MTITDARKYRDATWDFANANTKLYTHCFHSYPAMMIPQIAGRILDEYMPKGSESLFDPYCGTGTSLVEANLRNINAVGTDVNPLARLIAKVKTTPISLDLLNAYLSEFEQFTLEIKLGKKSLKPNIPSFKNIDFWFKKETIYFLGLIRSFIDHIDEPNVKDFFSVAFSETVRDVSLTRNGEFKLYRLPKERIVNYNPDVLNTMLKKLLRNKKGMEQYLSVKRGNARSWVYGFNSATEIPNYIIQHESVDIVLTSPPYGDSRTTVAYGQFSKLSNQWLGLVENNDIDKEAMGGKTVKEWVQFDYKPLDNAIEKIAENDAKRAFEVISFYKDYLNSIRNVANVVKPGGIVAYVVGNRKVKGIELPNDEITREFFERKGFMHLKTIIRKIPHKRMPRRNSPTNEVGKTDTTMNVEFIVILQKQKN